MAVYGVKSGADGPFLRRIIRDRETECDCYIPNRVEEVAARRGVSMGLSRYRIELQGQDRRGLRVRLSEDDIKYQKSRTSRRSRRDTTCGPRSIDVVLDCILRHEHLDNAH